MTPAEYVAPIVDVIVRARPPSPPPPSVIERAARRLWHEWGGDWAKHTVCVGCGRVVYCGAARRSGPYLCVECFDQR